MLLAHCYRVLVIACEKVSSGVFWLASSVRLTSGNLDTVLDVRELVERGCPQKRRSQHAFCLGDQR